MCLGHLGTFKVFDCVIFILYNKTTCILLYLYGFIITTLVPSIKYLYIFLFNK